MLQPRKHLSIDACVLPPSEPSQQAQRAKSIALAFSCTRDGIGRKLFSITAVMLSELIKKRKVRLVSTYTISSTWANQSCYWQRAGVPTLRMGVTYTKRRHYSVDGITTLSVSRDWIATTFGVLLVRLLCDADASCGEGARKTGERGHWEGGDEVLAISRPATTPPRAHTARRSREL